MTNTQVLTSFFKSGQDKDKNPLYTFEAREPGKNALVIEHGLYKGDAESLANQVYMNPQNFGF